MNKVFIIGRLTKEPEHKTTPSGATVTTFSVAVTRRMNREEADFLNVVAWRGLADTCAKYLVKGQQVAVAGEIRTRSYEAKDGSRRTVTEILADDVEFLARPGGYHMDVQEYATQDSGNKKDDFDELLTDDELPF